MQPTNPPSDNAERKLRVLYADDVPELREVVRIMLMRDGHQVEIVPDGALAWERIKTHPNDYDLLITDHHMPQMNGLDLVRHTRTLPYSGKIMVFSSEISNEVQEKYQQLSVDQVLPKPIYKNMLFKALDAMFGEGHVRPDSSA